MNKLDSHRISELQALAQQGKTPNHVLDGVSAPNPHEALLSQAVVLTPSIRCRLPGSTFSTPLEARFDRLLLTGKRLAVPATQVIDEPRHESNDALHEPSTSRIFSTPVHRTQIDTSSRQDAVAGPAQSHVHPELHLTLPE